MSLRSSEGPAPPREFANGEILSFDTVSKWLRQCGRNTKIYAGARLVGAERISIGDYSQIDEGVWIFAGDGVTIGHHVHMAFGSSVSGGGQCHIDDFVGIGAGVRLVTGTELVNDGGLTNPTVPAQFRRVHRGHIKVGAHSVIFTNALILPDVVIGEGAVVSAGAIVHRNLKPWGIYGGNPLVQVGVRQNQSLLQIAAQLRNSEEVPLVEPRP